MTVNNILEIALCLALLVWIGYRQLTWTVIVPQHMWRMPAVMAIVGVVLLAKDDGAARVTAADLGVLAIETAVSIALGAVMGLMAHFRPIDAAVLATFPSRDRGSSNATPTLQTRTGWTGMALWLVLIATRLAGEFYAHMSGSVLLTSTGVILLAIAVNRAARIVVLTQHAQRISAAVAAGSRVTA
jgi:hypothetical protein